MNNLTPVQLALVLEAFENRRNRNQRIAIILNTNGLFNVTYG